MKFTWTRVRARANRWRYECLVNDGVTPIGFVERCPSNLDIWDVYVHFPPFGTQAFTLAEGKKLIEGRVREKRLFRATGHKGEGT